MNELIHRLPVPPGPIGSHALAEVGGYRQQMQVDTGLTLALFLRTVRRRKWTLVLTALVFTLLAMIAAAQMTPKYTASTTVIVEPTQLNLGDIQGALTQIAPERDPVANQIEIISARSLAERVVNQLQLAELPEFNPTLRPPGMVSAATDWMKEGLGFWAGQLVAWFPWLSAIGLDQFAEGMTSDEQYSEQALRSAVIAEFLSKLRVYSRGQSRVIEVAFTSTDRERAAQIANTIADTYMVKQIEGKIEAIRRASLVLDERLAKMRENVAESERAVEEYRSKAGIVQGVNSGLVTEQISRLNTELITAQAAAAQAEARLAQVQAIKDKPDALETVPEVLNSRVIQQLREQDAKLRQEASNLSSKLSERHPDMVNIREQLRAVNGLIVAEVQRIISGLQAEVNAARGRVQVLQEQLNQLRNSASKVNESEIPLRAMEREADASRRMLETLLQRSRLATEQFELEGQDARVLSEAVVPAMPSFPNKRLIVAVAFIFSIFFGLLLIYIQEMLDHTFRSGEEVESTLGLPCLALVPMIRKPSLTGSVNDYVISRPISAFSEAMRSVRAALWLCNPRPKCVLITSSRPGESKTTTALSLARVAALSGERVILVDCDMRQPAIAEALRAPKNGKGLSDLLAGDVTREEVTQPDHGSDLEFITAGSESLNSGKLLRSGAMDALIDELRREYDLVVLDAPPTLALADAKILSTIVDATIYCVQWRDTTRSVVQNGIRALAEAGANIVGVALTQVNIKAHARAGFSDSELYHRRYRGYYTR